MIAEKVLVRQYEYVLHLNEEEAIFLRDLVNLAPSTIKKILEDKYSIERIAEIKNMGKESMWRTLSDALERDD